MLFIMVELHPLNSIELKKTNNGYIPNFVNTPDILPSVSVVTITYCREHLFELAVNNWQNFEYNGTMEWIILDDSPREIRKITKKLLPKNDKRIKYYSCNKIDSIGKKRNKIVELAQNEIIVTMDDDDYYPPERVEHAVDTLINNPEALCAGSSEIYVYFQHIQKMYQGGPYSKTHATAGTFAFRRELLNQTSYDDEASLAEEKLFLKNYTIPFVQLDPLKTILVFKILILLLIKSKNSGWAPSIRVSTDNILLSVLSSMYKSKKSIFSV